ncbi:MAG: hypothetical protein AAF753_07765 [Pseudomonadota bacterium]
MSDGLWLIGAAVLSFLICGAVRFLPIRDAPDGGRKQQTAPVPTAGGLGIAAAAIAMSVAWLLSAQETAPQFGAAVLDPERGALLACLFAAPFALGLIDDAAGLPALTKLAALVIWSSAAVGMLAPMPPMGVVFAGLLAAAAFAMFVFVNAANFMDGSNGLSLGSLAIMTAALYGPLNGVGGDCAPGCAEGAPTLFAAFLALLLPAACGGFLVWNMSGRLYAGDTGALGVGAAWCVLAGLAIDSLAPPSVMVWFILTLALPFFVDVGLTLALRLGRGQNLLRAHTDHAYQRLVAVGWPHWRVAGLWWGFSLACAAAAYGGLYLQLKVWPSVALFGPAFYVWLAVAACGAALWCIHRLRLSARLNGPG